MTRHKPHIYLAGAIVLHRECVLIVQRSLSEGFLPGVWGIPCGKLDDGEKSGDAALRELHEETGLDGVLIRHVGRLSFMSIWNGHQVENVQDNFLVHLRDTSAEVFPKVKLPEADQRSAWVPAEEIDHLGLDEHNLNSIRQALQEGHIGSVGNRS